MFTPLERLLAFRYLRSRRSEGFISVIAWFSFAGITLGVATLIIVMSVMNGFRAELVNRILGLNGHLGISSTLANGIDDYETLTSYIAQNPNIMAATPQIESQVLVSANNVTIGAVVRGVIWSDLAIRAPLWDSITDEIITRFRDDKAILIGKTMARNLNLAQGDSITLLAPKGRSTAFGSIPTRQSFIIGGIFDVGMHEYDSSFVFMPLPAAQKFFSMPDRVSGIELYINDPDDAPIVKAEMTRILPEKTAVFDWMDRNRNFLNALQVERNVMFLILTLIILVAAFNIISSMIMLVRSKNADIAVLRTMGLGRTSLLKIFLLTGTSIGIIGTIVGSLLGLLFCWNIEGIKSFIENLTGSELFSAEIYFLSKLPAVVEPTEVGVVIVMTLTLSLLASLYPAWRACAIAPAEVLRYE
ncbi:lipoprotein-releasing ABC transporter permease subunit [Alphaproteobacteria bacterium]|jgi:lipoprotein-releasing system permease protein|nr:lipoprotein-releasing ABC transporter permease subunit [Alphaproteobacteria bacterium]MDC0970512.1 lipoprotein-releasing ABC transporter permease subunit [Alphaproteobacteria bacterium]CAI8423863.1 MAG: Lipoprotein-releasing system transmembrane protein LolC [SAR116 cluster bacterium]